MVFVTIKTPPMGHDARREAGFLLRLLQEGEKLGMPHSRLMPRVGPSCHELRISDESQSWRIIYHIDADEIVVLDVFKKKAGRTDTATIERCRARLRAYQNAR